MHTRIALEETCPASALLQESQFWSFKLDQEHLHQAHQIFGLHFVVLRGRTELCQERLMLMRHLSRLLPPCNPQVRFVASLPNTLTMSLRKVEMTKPY